MQIYLHFGNAVPVFTEKEANSQQAKVLRLRSSETTSKHGIQTAVTLNANKIEQVLQHRRA